MWACHKAHRVAGRTGRMIFVIGAQKIVSDGAAGMRRIYQ
jgi:hypothetical protein